jgi:hypothetical protein
MSDFPQMRCVRWMAVLLLACMGGSLRLPAPPGARRPWPEHRGHPANRWTLADTRRAGCARRTCDTNSPFGAQLPSWDFWVCDYEPPGNFVGRKP